MLEKIVVAGAQPRLREGLNPNAEKFCLKTVLIGQRVAKSRATQLLSNFCNFFEKIAILTPFG